MAIAGVNKTQSNSKNDLDTKVIFNDDVNINKIVQYLDGPKWKVDYYNKVSVFLDENNSLDTDVPAGSDSYRVVRDTVFHVTTPLETNTPDNIIGEARINVSTIPAVGDIFVASLLGNRKGMFVITTVEKNNYNHNDIFLIGYKLNVFVDTDDTEFRNLETKVVSDNVTITKPNTDKTVIVAKSEMVSLLSLEEAFIRTSKNFINMLNKTNDSKMFLVPDEKSMIVDTHIEKIIYKLISVTTTGLSKFTRSGTDDQSLEEETILDILFNRTNTPLSVINKTVTVSKVGFNSNNAALRPLALMGVSGRVTVGETSVSNLTYETTATSDLIPVLSKNSYIFPERFYNNTDLDSWTLLEKLTRQYLNDEFITPSDVLSLYNDYYKWSRKELFYFMPILLIIISYCKNDFYKGE